MMSPEQTGAAYDRIAQWWSGRMQGSAAGLAHLHRAIGLCAKRDRGLDAGCGDGRLAGILAEAGFAVTGVDVSAAMLGIARQRHPYAQFVLADICAWDAPDVYDLVVAWDSTFHVPHPMQHEVHRRLCGLLAPGGVILFTAGGVDGERTGIMRGETFYHASLDQDAYMTILDDAGCRCVLFDRDQYPEDHCVIIGIKG